MALTIKIYCLECHKHKDVSIPDGAPPPRVCGECSREQEKREEDEHIQELEKMSYLERLKRVEILLFRLSKNGKLDF